MAVLNLANLPLGTFISILEWICENRIGDWKSLAEFVANDPDWYKKEMIPFECSDAEATMFMLRWS